jgi:membrane-anchored protein YejM (alkaline phosphatase superfamily)
MDACRYQRLRQRNVTMNCFAAHKQRHWVVIHRWGWTLVVNPDGTTTAWNKNKTKVLHSHGPPARAG